MIIGKSQHTDSCRIGLPSTLLIPKREAGDMRKSNKCRYILFSIIYVCDLWDLINWHSTCTKVRYGAKYINCLTKLIFVMRYFIQNRNKIVRARNHQELITKLRKSDTEQWPDNEAYMKAYADRRKLYDEIELNFTDETEFVRELIRYKLVKIHRKKTVLQSLFLAKR